jgi:caa(3)-type oxidase subunit IV
MSRAAMIAVAAGTLCALAWWFRPAAFLAAYLAAWWFCIGIALGGLANVWLHNLTGGAWGEAIRAPLLDIAQYTWIAALFFLPVLIGLYDLVLLGLTFGSAYLQMGAWNSVVNLTIAAAKAALVGIFFMHLTASHEVTRIFACVALFTLALLFILSGSDYATREIYRAPWQTPQQLPSKTGTQD